MKITTKSILWVILLLVSISFSACSTTDQSIQQTTDTNSFILKSPAFSHKGRLPSKYSQRGPDISPPLSWENPPPGTKSYVLTVDDPDAPRGTWSHWVIFNIPGDQTALAEGIPKKKKLSNGIEQGFNDWSKYGYGGPVSFPPGPVTHRYIFTLTALDVEKIDKPREGIIKKHTLGKATLKALFP